MKRVSFFLTADLEAGLKALKEEHGTPEAESMRRAIAAYLEAKGVKRKKPKRRTGKEKRDADLP